jgi:hypothetical protein
MARGFSGGALTGGLILIVLGIIFMLENLYGGFSFWRIFARYWPLILILIGIRKLYGYFTWQEVPSVPTKIEEKE